MNCFVWTLTFCQWQVAQHLALTTFIFPDSTSKSAPPAPVAHDVPVPSNATAQSVPFTPNLFSPFSHDSSLAFTVPFEQVSDFLKAVQEIPDPSADTSEVEQKKWIMRAARGPAGSYKAIGLWLVDAWGSFVDLIKVLSLEFRARNVECLLTKSFLARRND